ncbi:hypothetical protein OUZ56_028622 [Daphnia magna]|uniref:Uncharacterized protein n=1 Tax=Daphnia magna TaxID=35525 RepID=A0ABR0B4E7_9CRUS|nr:hypothetical protein OUZ56_028622 [Daphnia magna]
MGLKKGERGNAFCDLSLELSSFMRTGTSNRLSRKRQKRLYIGLCCGKRVCSVTAAAAAVLQS